jgi:hypothetical protein
MTRLFISFLVGFMIISCQKEEEPFEGYDESSEDWGTYHDSYVTGTITDSVFGTPVSGKVLLMSNSVSLPQPKDSIENGSYLFRIRRREGGKWPYSYPSELHLNVYENMTSSTVIGAVSIPIGQLVDNDTLIVDFQL